MEFFSSWTLVSVSSWDTVFFLFSVILWRYLRTAITLPWNVLFLKLNFFSCFHFLYIHEWYIWLSCLLYHTISSSTHWSYLCLLSMNLPHTCKYTLPCPETQKVFVEWMAAQKVLQAKNPWVPRPWRLKESSMAYLARFITLPFTASCRPYSQSLCKSLDVIPSLTHFLWLSF